MSDEIKVPRELFEWLVDYANRGMWANPSGKDMKNRSNLEKAIALRDSAKQEQPGAQIIPGKTAAMLEGITQACPTCPVGGEACAACDAAEATDSEKAKRGMLEMGFTLVKDERWCGTCKFDGASDVFKCGRVDYTGPAYPDCWQRKDAP